MNGALRTGQARVPKPAPFSSTTGCAIHVVALNKDVPELGTLCLVAGHAPVGLELREGIVEIPELVPSVLAMAAIHPLKGFLTQLLERYLQAAFVSGVDCADRARWLAVIGLCDELPADEGLAIAASRMEIVGALGVKDQEFTAGAIDQLAVIVR